MFLTGNVSQAQSKGPRENQEDYMAHVPFAGFRSGRGHLLAIMDGHDGEGVAKYCKEIIPRLFDPCAANVAEELKKVVSQLDARTCLSETGSTLSLAYISESSGIAITAVLGDSPVIVLDRESRLHISEEHNVRTNVSERLAAIRRGAIYEDGYICLEAGGDGVQLSRALGDQALRSILNRTPSICRYRINAGSLVILASDGMFDPEHGTDNAEAVNELLGVAKKVSVSSDILTWREERKLEDNCSVIMWKAEKRWYNFFS